MAKKSSQPDPGDHERNSCGSREDQDHSKSESTSSIGVDNLIDQYDGSFLSKSVSLISNFYSFRPTNNIEEDNATISTTFYSALPDAFSLNEFEHVNENEDLTEDKFFIWEECETGEQTKMLRKQDFQIFWNDITLEIKPKINFAYIKNKIDETCELTNACGFMIGRRAVDYSLTKDRPPYGTTTILNKISGSFKSGEMTALLGPSGAGKTSLINFLSRRRENGYSGQYYVNDAIRRIRISTLPQHDSLPEYLTVRENLLFASRLKNAHLNIDHSKYIEKISQLLGLSVCLDTKTRKISGGEQKRLAIAQELLSKPDVLILDEPTSGLDSVTCYKTLCVLKELVKASSRKLIDPIAIVLSIHQPQEEAFELFDKIYVIAPRGRAIYDGPPQGCIQYVNQHTGIQMPSGDYNPASFLIEIASGEYGIDPIKILEDKHKENFNSLVRATYVTNDSNNAKDNNRFDFDPRKFLKDKASHLDSYPRFGNDHDDSVKSLQIDHNIPQGYSFNTGHFLLKTKILFERCWISNIRDPRYSIARLLFFLLTPLALSVMMNTDSGRIDACPRYYPKIHLKDVARNDSYLLDEGVQKDLLLSLENLGLFFILIYGIVVLIIGAMAVTFSYDIQRSVKEFHNGWYSMSSHLIARTLSEILMHTLLPTISVIITFKLTQQEAHSGMSNFNRFLLFDMGVILVSLISQVYGMIIGAIFIGDITTALFVSQGIVLPMAFLSGFVTRPKNMASFVRAISHASFMRHGLDIAVISRYGFGACGCNNSEITGRDPQMEGVPEKLHSFVDYWMGSMDQDETLNNFTTTKSPTSTNSPSSDDLFQLFAKQVFLYNTRGVDIKSCADMKPYQMVTVDLEDDDIKLAFGSLVAYLFISMVCLFVTVKLVMRYRTSI